MSNFKKLLALSPVGVALICASLLYAADRRPRKKPAGASLNVEGPLVQGKAPSPIVIVPEPPRPFFEVWSSDKRMQPDEKRVFDQVRETLGNLQYIPEYRAKQFSWLEVNNLHATGWAAELVAAEPIENGYLVTLRIIPRVGSPDGSMVSVADYSIERYNVFDDRTWAFVDAVTPPGKGQPWIIMD